MATSPIDILLEQNEPLSKEQAWELLKSMFGSFHDMYEAAGGVKAVIRERYGDGDEEDPV